MDCHRFMEVLNDVTDLSHSFAKFTCPLFHTQNQSILALYFKKGPGAVYLYYVDYIENCPADM